MKRKSLIIVLVSFVLLFISSISFATNDIKNGVSNVTDTMIDGTAKLGNDVRNGIGTAEGAIENGVNNLGNSISQGMQSIGNFVTDDMQNNNESNNEQYTATRTTASDLTNTGAIDSNMWTWIIVAIAGIVIVGLVWYYARSHEER